MISKPILFSGPMVRGILEGRKTQTRRVVKGKALEWLAEFTPEFVAHPDNAMCPHPAGSEMWVRETWALASIDGYRALVARSERMPSGKTLDETDGGLDEVWLNDENKDKAEKLISLDRWRPSIFMPRWASRITLTVTDVRVQRLQDISRDDAAAEGLSWVMPTYGIPGAAGSWNADPRISYRWLWESINGSGSWAANPWIWAYTFERVK